MVVDDVKLNRDVLVSLLRRLLGKDADIHSFESAYEATVWVAGWAKDHEGKTLLCLLDNYMPIVTGVDLAPLFAHMAECLKFNVFLAGVTAAGEWEGDHIHHLVTKPLTLDKLQNLMNIYENWTSAI